MGQYLIRRLLLSVLSLFLVVTIVFIAVRMMPGDIVDQFFQDSGSTPEQAQKLREKLGLADPVLQQYGDYLVDLVQGKFGSSLWTGQDIWKSMQTRIPITVELAILTLILGTAVGIPLGVISAVKQGAWSDYVLRSVSILGISVPFFWLAILTISIPAYYWHWSPPVGHVGFFSDPITNLWHYLIPAVMMSVFMVGSIMRLLRATLLEVLRLDYMRTAAAKGLSTAVQLRRHALRNALIPVVTLIGLRLVFLLSGSAVVESIYGLPGLGQWTLDSISRRDFQVVQAITVFVAFIIITINLLVDMSYGLIDPRVRVSR